MTLTTTAISKRIDQKIRIQTAKVIKDMRKLLTHGRSAPESACDCSAHQIEQMEAEDKYMYSASAVVLTLGIAALMLIGGCFFSKPVHAEITEAQAVRAVLGEAEDQGFLGMVAVSEVIRTRGSLKGINGYKNVAKRFPTILPKYKAMALKAWRTSANSHITKGATNFENITAFGCPSWVKGCVETFRHKDHVFYKEIV